MGMMKGSTNPSQMLNNLAAANPQMKSVMGLVNQHGGDAKAAFYDLANKQGVDPNEVINALKQ